MIRTTRGYSVLQRSPGQGKALVPLQNQTMRRAHMKLDSDPPYEDSLVLWLQAGCWYADIRVNLAQGEIYSGFGGVVWWQAPKLWFQHLINISGDLSDQDIGDIELTLLGCYERGTVDMDGQTVNFEEKWLCKQSQQTSVYTFSQRGRLKGLEVQTDQYCILMIEDNIKLFCRSGRNRWSEVFATTPRENCWQPTRLLPRPGWQLQEMLGR